MLRIATNNLEAMSGSETGLIASRDAYGMGLQRSPIPSQPVNMRMSFSPDGGAGGGAVFKPIPVSASYEHQPAAAGGGDGFAQPQPASVGFNMNTTGGEPAKKKRGRPRKYGPDGTMALAVVPSAAPLSQTPSTVSVTQPSAVPSSSTSPAAPRVDSAQQQPSSSLKKPRGRPPGSISKKQHQMEAPGSAGLGFTPHVITVKAGEDVSSKIMAFSQNGPRAVCILSANGAISNVTLRQPATSGGSVTYEGRFEILSLSGSFMLSENGGQRSRTGGLSVSLAGPDGRVLGGGVGGLLTAASPVQVVVGSFIADGGSKELKTANQVESFYGTATLHPPGSGVAAANSPPSHGTLSESSGGPGSPGNHSTEVYNNANQQGMSGIPWK